MVSFPAQFHYETLLSSNSNLFATVKVSIGLKFTIYILYIVCTIVMLCTLVFFNFSTLSCYRIVLDFEYVDVRDSANTTTIKQLQ